MRGIFLSTAPHKFDYRLSSIMTAEQLHEFLLLVSHSCEARVALGLDLAPDWPKNGLFDVSTTFTLIHLSSLNDLSIRYHRTLRFSDPDLKTFLICFPTLRSLKFSSPFPQREIRCWLSEPCPSLRDAVPALNLLDWTCLPVSPLSCRIHVIPIACSLQIWRSSISDYQSSNRTSVLLHFT